MMQRHRAHGLWHAFILHRVSGLLLALFLPAHFYVLALAVTDPAALDGFLAWTDLFIVKVAEWGVVFLLAVHFFGGLRLLAFELLPWRSGQKTLAALAAALAFLVSAGFFLNAV